MALTELLTPDNLAFTAVSVGMIGYSLKNFVSKKYETSSGKVISAVGMVVTLDVLSRLYTGESIIDHLGADADKYNPSLSRSELGVMAVYYVHSAYKAIDTLVK